MIAPFRPGGTEILSFLATGLRYLFLFAYIPYALFPLPCKPNGVFSPRLAEHYFLLNLAQYPRLLNFILVFQLGFCQF